MKIVFNNVKENENTIEIYELINKNNLSHFIFDTFIKHSDTFIKSENELNRSDGFLNSNVNNKLRNKIIEILKYIGKFNINILIGAGTSIPCMPSMKILSKAIQDDTKIITKIEEIQKEHKSEFDFNSNEIENTISLIESKSIIFPEMIQYRELYELIIQKILFLFRNIDLQKKSITKNNYKKLFKLLSDIRMIYSKIIVLL